MKTTFEVTDLFVNSFNFPKSTPYSELSEEEKEQKFMDVLTNGLPGLPNLSKRFVNGIKYSPAYYNRQHKNQLGDPFVVVPKVPKNKKWYDTFR